MSAVPATPPLTSAHARWCRQHTAEGCLSEQIQIPDLPFAIWVSTLADAPAAKVSVVIDGAIAEGGGTLMIDLTVQPEDHSI